MQLVNVFRLLHLFLFAWKAFLYACLFIVLIYHFILFPFMLVSSSVFLAECIRFPIIRFLSVAFIFDGSWQLWPPALFSFAASHQPVAPASCFPVQSPDGESPSTAEVDLFMSTQRIKVLNADTQVTKW